MRTLKSRRSDKHRGFVYRFWFVDEVTDGCHYRSRAQVAVTIGRWMLGMSSIVLPIIGLAILVGYGLTKVL